MTGVAFVNAPWWIDSVLALLFVTAAGAQFAWLGFYGHSIGRWMQALGWTGLSVRLVGDLVTGGDPHVAAVAIPFLALVSGGTAYTAIAQIRALQLDVRCMRDPLQHCFRADRVRAALAEKRVKG